MGDALAIGPLFEEHRSFLWGLSYRITGSAADADDVVQDTFVRAMERPPRHAGEPLRPWLVKVALNLARDLQVAFHYYAVSNFEHEQKKKKKSRPEMKVELNRVNLATFAVVAEAAVRDHQQYQRDQQQNPPRG